MRHFHLFWIGVCAVMLVVACNNENRVVATSTSPVGVFQIQNTVGDVDRLILQSPWLVWSYFISPANPTEPGRQGLVVYDIHAEQPVYTTTVAAEPINIIGNDLYYARLQDFSLPPNEAGWSLNRLDLTTRTDAVLLDKVPVGIQTNGKIAVWSLTDICQPFSTCAPPTGSCQPYGRRVYVQNLATGQTQDLGESGMDVFVSAVTDSLIYLWHGSDSCSAKAYGGPYVALDLAYRELRQVAFEGGSPDMDTGVTDVSDRRALIGIGFDRLVVMDIPAQHDTQIVLNVAAGRALGLAGHDILLYAPKGDKLNEELHPGLVALDLTSAYSQQLAGTDQVVRRVASDGRYVAWLTRQKALYVAELHLRPSGQPTILGTPAPTLEFYFPSLHPTPMGTAVGTMTPTAPPLRTAEP